MTTRIIAGFIAIIPLYVIGLLSSYFATYLSSSTSSKQSPGTYDHYFNLFLPPGDVFWSFFKVLVFAIVMILIHCYSATPPRAARPASASRSGRAVRTAIVTVTVTDFFLSLAIWGSTTSVRIAG